LAQAPSFKDAYAEEEGTPDRDRMMAYEAERLPLAPLGNVHQPAQLPNLR